MNIKMFRRVLLAIAPIILILAVSSAAFGAATIIIQNNDGAGEGFNDPTAAAPVGGNNGATIGQQRLNVFQDAANIWGATLTSSVTITVRAQFDPLTCTANSAVLGSAGALNIFANFSGAPFSNTWYGGALANKLAGADQSGNPEINATFNSNLGNVGCLTNKFFYYGFDGNEGANVDLEAVLLHEFAHGLGFQTFTSGSTGATNGSFFSAYDRFMVDDTTGLSWLQMTNAERVASAINTNNLSWTGPIVSSDVASVLTTNGSDTSGRALLFTPNPFQSGSSVSHWTTLAFPNQLMEPAINSDLTHTVTAPTDLTFDLLSDVGWVASTLPSSMTKTTGSPQSTAVNAPFATPLSVTVNPVVSGVKVIWTAPVSGASGTFAGTGTRTATSLTNALGIATAPTFTANGTIGTYSVQATAPGAGSTTLAGALSPFSLTNSAGVSPPTISGVTSSAVNGTYGLGSVIPVQVTFSENVNVTGTPQLTLETGASDAVVNYSSGSGTPVLTFNYSVSAGHASSDLDCVSSAALALSGGTITSAAALAATLTLPTPGAAGSLGANKTLVIDGVAPTVLSVSSSTANNSYGAGAVISIQASFSEAVTVTGTPLLALNSGGNASYASGSGTSSLTFNYTVAGGQNSSDLDQTSSSALTLNGGSIKDAALNASILTLSSPGAAGSLGANKAIVIDTTAPVVTNVTSSTVNATYGVGAAISIQATFSEAVTVSGTPLLALNSGGSASYSSGTGTTTLTFNYTVAAAQNSADLDYTSTSALTLNGGTIRDGVLNNASLTLASPGASGSLGFNKAIVINTTAPTSMSANANTTPQSTAINTTFSTALSVTVRDAGNSPVSGVNVTFTAPGAGASGTFSNATATITVATNASGIATAPFTANLTTGGPYTVTAASSGLTTVNFSLTNTVGAATSLSLTSGSGQSAAINAAFTNPLVVTVRDVGSNPVSGVNVTFTSPGSGASGRFSNAATTITISSNASGVASAPFTANAVVGSGYNVSAAASGLTTVNFPLSNTAGPAASMSTNVGTTPQSASIFSAFATALGVTVRDAGNNPVSGVNVTFTAPGAGTSGFFSNSTTSINVATNASGIASAPITANGTAGGPYTVSAAVSGLTNVNFSLTNNAGAAASMSTNAGTTPQSATVNTAFATALSVTVRDAGNNPVSGVNVTFTAPGSAISGVFSNFTTSITVATNASGIASAPFTANTVAGGPYTVSATALGLSAVNFSLTNDTGTAASLTANAGTTPQSAVINAAFGTPPAVTVRDAFNNPVSGVNVSFTSPGSGASGRFSNSTTTITVATNASGVASAPFTANSVAGGPYAVTAAASGLATVNFSLTNTAGAASSMSANAGTTPQTASINTTFANALAVAVRDASLNPVSGVNVTFTSPASGVSGTFSNAANTMTVATNASGIASPGFTANSVAGGPYNVVASSAGLASINLSLTNSTGAAASMTTNAGTTPQSTAINSAFAASLSVTVRDAGNNPVSGVGVTFTAPASGASGLFGNSTTTIAVATNASGIASAPITANAVAGGPYNVSASSAGLSQQNFSLTNITGAAASMTANAGTTPQTTTVNTAFPNSLAVSILDAGSNPVGGQNVTFTAPASGASGLFNNSSTSITVATNASGVASAPFTANNVAGGPYAVTAAASGLTTVNFSLTNTVGAASSISANVGTTPQSAAIFTAFANALAVTIRDAGSNPVSGVNVTFTAPGSGASGLFSNSTAPLTVVTNASGVASAPITANGTAGGPYTVSAAVSGLTNVNFSLTNNAGAAASMSANAGTTPQSATVNTAFATVLGVTVRDAGNNPVSGVNVTFTAPGSAISGVFSNFTTSITVATDASGVASAPFTANTVAGGLYTVSATATGLSAVSFSLTNATGASSSITANAGTTPQSAAINSAFAVAPSVTVRDAFNNPVSGVNVTFNSPGSGPSGRFSNATISITVATNASGVAAAPFTANATSGGPYVVTSGASGLSNINFSLTNTAGPASSMSANAGTTPQTASIGTTFANALGVTVRDAGNNPVSGVNVTFTAPGSGFSGSFANASNTITVATNASGIAAPAFAANTVAGGPYSVSASANGLSTVNFSLTNATGAASSMTANAGTTPQSAAINSPFATALSVTVRDAGNNPVSGVGVTFTAPANGASGVFSNGTTTISVATNAAGIAATPFTANAAAGGPYNVSASSVGLTQQNFALTNTTGAAASMTANAGSTPQSATINAFFGTPLSVTVRDAGNNPVSGVSVVFTAPASGVSGVFGDGSKQITVLTNASGISSVSFNANSIAGGLYNITAAAAGLPTVNFSLTNTPGSPTAMTVNAGTTPQSAAINSAFATPLSVTVVDAGNNPVPGVGVTFTAPANGASGRFTNNSTTIAVATNAAGIASAPFTANAIAGGPYNVTASSATLSQGNFSLTNTAGAAASITANAGTTPQSTFVNTAFTNALAVTVLDAGGNPIVGQNVTFTAPAAGASGLFGNSSTSITVSTNASGVASAPFTANGTIGGPYIVQAQTAGLGAVGFSLTNTVSVATVSGRVLTSSNQGLNKATVVVTDSNNVSITVQTNSFGLFSFSNLLTGQTYNFKASSKRFRFNLQTVQVNGNMTLPDFVGVE